AVGLWLRRDLHGRPEGAPRRRHRPALRPPSELGHDRALRRPRGPGRHHPLVQRRNAHRHLRSARGPGRLGLRQGHPREFPASRKMRRPFVAGLLGFILAACATSALQPIRDGNVRLEEDEQRLWARVEQEQKKFEASGALYRDPELEAYLTGVARKLQPAAVLQVIPFRVAVVKNPWLNAFAMPNGALYIHSGLLARLENEAQLATILGHEMVHVTHRHAIRDFRSAQNKTAFLATMNVAVGGVPVLGGIADLVGTFGTTAAITGYARDQEREADREGLDLMVRAGYDPTEARKAFVEMKKELDEQKIKESFFYSSHPRLQERIENFESSIKTTYRDRQGGATNTDVFLKKIQRAVLENAQLDLKAGRFGTAQWGAEKAIAI